MDITSRNEKLFTAQTIAKVGVLAAMAGILMYFQFPLPFAPPFMKVDISDVPSLIGGFALGPIPGVMIVLIKNIIHVIIKGTSTAYVGELSNFIVGSAFVVVSSLIYQKDKTKKTAVKGLLWGTLVMTALAVLSNYFIIFPLYSKAFFGGDVNGFVPMAAELNKFVKSYETIMVFAVTPFNIVKGLLASFVTMLLYKRVSPLLKL